MINEMLFLAASDASFNDAFLQYGAVGLLAVLSLGATRVLFKREITAHQKETERADRLEAELRKLNETVQQQYLSTLTEATLAMSDILKAGQYKSEADYRAKR